MAEKRKIYLIDPKFRIKFSALPGLSNLALVWSKGALGRLLSGNDKGFSLMGTVMAAGLMGGLALVMGSIVEAAARDAEEGRDGSGGGGAVEQDRPHPVRRGGLQEDPFHPSEQPALRGSDHQYGDKDVGLGQGQERQ